MNGAFATNITSWATDFWASSLWSSTDAHGSAGSGSLAVENATTADVDGSTTGGSSQCIAVTANTTYDATASVYMASGQGTGTGGLIGVYYPSANCSGTQIGVESFPETSQTDAWTPVGGATKSPAGAQSLSLRVVVEKPFRQATFEARFDDVEVRAT